jgi:hypothetical protein
MTPPEGPQELRVHGLRFLREQDGEPERLLKHQLIEQFSRRGVVERAYLARIWTGDEVVVGLCIVRREGRLGRFVTSVRDPRRPDRRLLIDVQAAFQTLFGRQASLDILWITPAEEIELRHVCRPFFSATQRIAS